MILVLLGIVGRRRLRCGEVFQHFESWCAQPPSDTMARATCADWLSAKVEVRRAAGRVPQGTIVLRDSGSQAQQVLLGSLALSTDGLGLTPGNTLNLIQASEGEAESALLSAWFDAQWQSLAANTSSAESLPRGPSGEGRRCHEQTSSGRHAPFPDDDGPAAEQTAPGSLGRYLIASVVASATGSSGIIVGRKREIDG